MEVDEVNEPVVGVVAPTVPLILIEAVPVKLVTVPDDGVPKTGVVMVGEVRVLFVSVCVAAKVTTVSLELGNVIVVESVPARVKVLVTANVLELVMVRVPVVVEMVRPLTVVGVIAPATIVRAGVEPPELDPEKPLAVAIETAETPPPPPALN